MGSNKDVQKANKWLVAVLVSVGVFIALLDTTIVDIVLPKMMSAMETDVYGIQWVVITYFLGAAIAMTAVGWFCEITGHRNAYIIGIILFVVMSTMAGLANSLPVMLASRFFQGVAEGIMIPVGLVILYETFPVEERGLAMGVYGISASFAPALGPTFGGLLTEYLNWRWVFFINIPVGVLDIILIWFLMKNYRTSESFEHFDFMGFICLASAFSALIIFLGKGQEKGWLHSDYILILVVFFVVFAIAAVIWLAFSNRPLFPRRILGHRPFRLGLLAMVMFSMTAYGFFFLLPIYLQRVHGYTTLQSGLILLPGALFAGVSTLLSGALSDRINPKWIALFMLVGAAIASWIFHTDIDTPRNVLYMDYIVWGFFIGGTFAPVSLIALSTLEEQDIANGSTLINVSRLIAGSIGTSYATSLLSTRTDTFYDALSAGFTWNSFSVSEFMTKLGSMSGWTMGYFDPDAWASLLSTGKSMILLKASSYAFHAAYQHLAFCSLAAAFIILLIRSNHRRPKAPVH